MLSYLDRRPDELDLQERVTIGALRLWAAEMQRRRCPLGLLRELFSSANVRGALWPAHNFFYWALSHSERTVELGCRCCARVSDDEAALLSAIFAENSAQAHAALASFMLKDAITSGARLGLALGAELRAASIKAAP